MNEQIQNIFMQVIPLGGQPFNGELLRDATDQWDSLAHLRLITALETELGCTFSMDDIQRMDRFSVVVEITEARLAASGQGH